MVRWMDGDLVAFPGQLIGLDHGRSHLLDQVAEVSRGMGDKYRVRPGRRPDLLQHVEVLRHQHKIQDVLGGRTWHRLLELVHGVSQASYDCFPLICDALALQSLALGVSLGRPPSSRSRSVRR